MPISQTQKKSMRRMSIDFVQQTTAEIESLSKPLTEYVSPSKQSKGEIELISDGFSISKPSDSGLCEDAYFIGERSFGIADGVSGWNDYGFSSHAFSHQLMGYCLQEINSFDSEPNLETQAT
jgi:hypothetical protein